MTLKTFVILVACLALVGCGRRTEQAAKPTAVEPDAAPADAHKEPPNTVEVDEGMFSDAGALGLTLFAMRFARRPATAQRTYGSYRAEILAALVNGATLVAVALYIFVEAFERIRTPPEVQGGLMLAVAFGGLLVNAAGLWILHTGNDANLNVRGAWLHVLTDALGSLQAIVAGALIWAYGWN